MTPNMPSSGRVDGGVVITDQESLKAAWDKWEDLEWASNGDLTPDQYRAIHDQQIAIEQATDEYHRRTESAAITEPQS